jgi:hypothetical protein
LLGAALAGALGVAQGADESSLVEVGVGAEYSDNIRRVTVDPESDTIVTASLATDVRRATTRYDLGLNTDLAYDYYTGDTYDSELRGNALFDFDGQIVRNRLSWYVEDSFGQLRLAAATPDTPDNRENINVLTTGPRFTQPIGSRSRFILTGVYELEDYERSPLDATVAGGDLSFRHDLSPRQYLELTATKRETRYDDDVAFGDYDVEEYYLTWSASGAKTSVTLSAGETHTTGEGLDDESTLLALDAEREVGKYGTLVLTGRSQTANTADAFRVEQGGGALDLNTQPIVAVGEPFNFDFLEIGYDLGGRRVSATIRVNSERDRYEVATNNDRDREALELGAQWQMSPMWSSGAGIEYAREHYIETGQRFKELTWTLEARARLTRALSLSFGGSLTDRSGAVDANVYDETRVRIMLTYTGGKTG